MNKEGFDTSTQRRKGKVDSAWRLEVWWQTRWGPDGRIQAGGSKKGGFNSGSRVMKWRGQLGVCAASVFWHENASQTTKLIRLLSIK